MKKQCILCSAEFEAKRADANYCSEKCRAKANYEIRKKKASGEFSPDNLPVSLPLNSPIERSKNTKIEVNGILNTDEIRQMIVNTDSTIANFCAENTALKAQITELSAQKSHFCLQIIEIKEIKIKKLEAALLLSDTDLYNTYLNGEYQKAVKTNNILADFKLITPHKLSLDSSANLLFKINQYRLKVKNLIIAHNSEVSKLNLQIQDIDTSIKNLNKAIDENNSSVRFNQTRIMRLEQLLSG
ncbi:hypothetical protein [Carboxylicivirga linearis]|uniref:DUF2116 family Zn-ribbon domain-containing protein n=1 Tax=Carboxylicivirga linearis TaxID=1628157 RepID=A0ABS5JW57_9BACT|nr:hypothetical protein [Carboxylicivirga linearis]MBS2099132.1 hypothetical protein [Carboxylicivirga linearis]